MTTLLKTLDLTATKLESKNAKTDIAAPKIIKGAKNFAMLNPEDFTAVISLFLLKKDIESRVARRTDNGSTLYVISGSL
jgi:hypothetical protein